MKNSIKGKPEKFNEYQGLGILALEDVNTLGVNRSGVMLKHKTNQSSLANDFG